MRSTKASVAAAITLVGMWASAGVAVAEPTPAPAPPAPKNTIDADGTYAVGADIAPGVYKSAGPVDGGACYWKRTSGEKMVDNGLTKRAPVVTIDPTDTSFTTNDCQTWQLTDCSQSVCPPPPGPPSGAIGPILSILGSQLGSAAGAPPAAPPPAAGPTPPG
jgi:hypothetical protein